MAEAGRPSEYKPEFCEQIIKHCESGLSIASFAGVIKKSSRTLDNWRKEHEAFEEACLIAESCSLLFWEKQGVDGLKETKSFNPQTGETFTEKLNAPIWIFNMKARFKKYGWTDKVEISGDVAKPIQLQYAIGETPPEHAGLFVIPLPVEKAANE